MTFGEALAFGGSEDSVIYVVDVETRESNLGVTGTE
jgi:hypothetical protein